MIRSKPLFLSLIFFIAFFILSGCTSTPKRKRLAGRTAEQIEGVQHSAVIEKESISALSDNEDLDLSPTPDYIIGINDALYVNVNGQAELGSPLAVATGEVRGSRVDGKGFIHLPLVGKIKVAGHTIEQVIAKLESAYRPFIKDPWVIVEVSDYKSQPLYLIGQFKKPGVVYLDRPINLLQGIAMGNGLDEMADLRRGRLIRNDKIMGVDIYGLLREGALTQNIWLQPGDIIFVPDNKLQQVYVLGGVKAPGAVSISHNQLSLTQAIAGSGGLKRAGHNNRQVRIIRSLSTTRGELITLDMEKVLRGEAAPFFLIAGDIVYVPQSGLGSWNQTIDEILPTLQTIGALLNPFVQIKFLSD